MKQKKSYITIVTIVLLVVVALAGVCSINFGKSYDVINQYGQNVQMYGAGIYAHDSYFKAPLSIGSDMGILLALVPLFIYSYVRYRKQYCMAAELRMVSVYSVAFYYAASICFGVTYNRLFLVYLALFVCSLFGMLMHMRGLKGLLAITQTKGQTAFLLIGGIALIVAWLPDVIPSVIDGTSLSLIGVYTTEITYVIDMGIVSPICFIAIYLLSKKDGLGTLAFAMVAKLCIVIGMLMITQTVMQIASGVDVAFPVLATKSLSFLALAIFGVVLNRKAYRELEAM